jgi:hypothetical protein
MKVVLCLAALLAGLLVRKSRELERLWLGETSLPPRAGRHVPRGASSAATGS